MRIDYNRRLPVMFGTALAFLYDTIRSPFIDTIEVTRNSRNTQDLGRLHDIDALRSRVLQQKHVEAVAADRAAVCMRTTEARWHFSHNGPIAGHPRYLAYRWARELPDLRTQAELVQQLQAGRS
jgi:hypothetical protein